jgi:hypothetical protein
MMRRMSTAWCLRIATGDTYDLREMVDWRNDFDAQLGRAIREARAAQGDTWSWTAIGDAVGCSRQAAQQRWGRA